MGALKARVAGNFVPLEYSGAPNPQNALGVVAIIPLAAGTTISITSGGTAISGAAPFTMLVGRRYRLTALIRSALGGGSAFYILWTEGVGGANIRPGELSNPGGEMYQPAVTSYGGGVFSWIVDGDGVARNYALKAVATGASTSIYNDGAPQRFHIEDIGPTAAPALPLPPTPQAWTPVTFANANWRSHANDPLYLAQYRKIGDEVQLTGLAERRNSTLSVTEPLLTMPVGYRNPTRIKFFTAIRSDAKPGLFQLNPSGDLNFVIGGVWSTFAATDWVSLDSVVFSVTP